MSSAVIRRRGSCLYADVHLEFGRSEEGYLMTRTSGERCQTWSLQGLSLSLPKASFQQDKKRNSDHESTSHESKPSKSSLRADRRKRQKKTRLRSLRTQILPYSAWARPTETAKEAGTAAKAKVLERRPLFLQPSFGVVRRMVPGNISVLGRTWASATAWGEEKRATVVCTRAPARLHACRRAPLLRVPEVGTERRSRTAIVVPFRNRFARRTSSKGESGALRSVRENGDGRPG